MSSRGASQAILDTFGDLPAEVVEGIGLVLLADENPFAQALGRALQAGPGLARLIVEDAVHRSSIDASAFARSLGDSPPWDLLSKRITIAVRTEQAERDAMVIASDDPEDGR